MNIITRYYKILVYKSLLNRLLKEGHSNGLCLDFFKTFLSFLLVNPDICGDIEKLLDGSKKGAYFWPRDEEGDAERVIALQLMICRLQDNNL